MSEQSPNQNAKLKALTTSAGKLSPGFWGERQQFFITVPNALETVSVTAETSEPRASLAVNGAALPSGQASEPIDVKVGRNVIPIEVTAPDGNTKNTYTIRVIRSYPTPNWVRVAEKCPWSPRDSAGEMVFKGRMWILGGYTPDLVSDVWASADGVNWEKVGEVPSPAGINIPLTWVYDDKMWVVSQDGKLFSSPDGADWTLVTEQAPWRGRYSAGAVVFHGRMWTLGGSGGKLFNDVWSSTDGANWTLETSEAPWSKRQLFSLITVYDGHIWILGGGLTVYHPFRAYNDVWKSSDGRTWTKVTEAAAWPVRIWSSSAVYKNRLWVLTGFRAESTWNNFDDVWYSSDGATWHRLVTESLWSPRHEVSVYVFDGKLWVVGGNAWPLQNDVWTLEIKGLTFTTQPVIEEFATAQYSYHAHADFNESRQPVRYRLLEATDWLKVNPDSGLLRGTPPAVGEFPVTIEAFDAAGETARQSYVLHVI